MIGLADEAALGSGASSALYPHIGFCGDFREVYDANHINIPKKTFVAVIFVS